MMTGPKDTGDTGFKDFMGFNDTLLAKIAWQILQYPDSLWVRLLKSANTSFMNAVKGHKATWVWDSILMGHDFLKKHFAGKWAVVTLSRPGRTHGSLGLRITC